MTSDSAFKRAVRERMQSTGEKYTQARRAVAADPALGSQDPLRTALRPGRVVGIVSGGGGTNLALVIPYLIKFQDRGHWLTYLRSERTGLFEVPSPFDFVCARGLASYDEVGDLIAAEDPRAEALLMALPDDTATHGPLLAADWRQHLAEKAVGGRAPVVWIQDVQVGAPFAPRRRDEDSDEAIAEQLALLRDVAVESGAIVAVGHCMPYDWHDGWDVIVEGADDTFVIASDDTYDVDGATRGATIEHHSHDAPPANFRRTIDTSFSRWRRTVMHAS